MSAAPAPDPHVLLIGDSIATGMLWYPPAVTVVQRNLAFEWQVAVCRTLTGESCPFLGARAPTALDLIDSRPSVPPWVVLEMGYNDAPDTFASAVDQTISALLAKGAKHILWLTLRAARDPYPELNETLAEAAAAHPQVELVDWNAYSTGRTAWFQNDGVHLTSAGGVAMAHLVHGSLFEQISPLHLPTPVLPALEPHHRYRAQLRARGGTPPYRWTIVGGDPPRGLRLSTNGALTGRPATAARLDVVVRVTDVDGLEASARIHAHAVAG